jgi:integrase
MPDKSRSRAFGTVRKRGSGRWQVRYLGPDGRRRAAPRTFPTKRDAEQWLSVTEAEMLKGEWSNPALGKITLAEYGRRWIAERTLSARTVELYESLFRLHLVPYLGDREIGSISTETVRAWRKWLQDNGRSAVIVAKAYRLLRAIMNTAVDDDRVIRNPCRIKGAAEEKTPERPVATVPQVFALAEEMPPRFRALVLTAAFTGLRWGELIALRRCDVDLEAPYVRVVRKLAQLRSGEVVVGPTKSAAGVRTVALPELLLPDLRRHLKKFTDAADEALVFTGEKGAMLSRGNWHTTVSWVPSVKAAGLPEGFHFHDLRHTGNQLAASAGASTRELMRRMGHGSMRAALIYQHATDDRDQEIAKELSRRAEEARKKAKKAGKKKRKSDKGRSDGESGPTEGP